MDCAAQARHAARTDAERRSFEADFGFDRHSNSQAMIWILSLPQSNPDRQSLHDFHIVAGGVLRRHEAVLLAARTAHPFHVGLEVAADRVNVNRRALPGLHAANLRFLEIRGDPDIAQRNDREELLARLNTLAIFDRLLSD